MRAARSGSEDLTVRVDSGEWFLLFDLACLASFGGGSGSGVAEDSVRGRAVKASGGVMADMTLPNAE